MCFVESDEKLPWKRLEGRERETACSCAHTDAHAPCVFRSLIPGEQAVLTDHCDAPSPETTYVCREL